MDTAIVERIEYYVRPESDGKYEVVKVTEQRKIGYWIDKLETSESEVVFGGRLSDCESFIRLTKEGLLRDD